MVGLMLRSHISHVLLVLCVAGVLSISAHAQPEKPEILREPEWDSLFDIQRALANDHNQEVLRLAKVIEDGSINEFRPAEKI